MFSHIYAGINGRKNSTPDELFIPINCYDLVANIPTFDNIRERKYSVRIGQSLQTIVLPKLKYVSTAGVLLVHVCVHC